VSNDEVGVVMQTFNVMLDRGDPQRLRDGRILVAGNRADARSPAA